MKKSTLTILAKASILALSLLLLAPLMTSVAGFSADKKGNEAKGRFYFRGTCKNCHCDAICRAKFLGKGQLRG